MIWSVNELHDNTHNNQENDNDSYNENNDKKIVAMSSQTNAAA